MGDFGERRCNVCESCKACLIHRKWLRQLCPVLPDTDSSASCSKISIPYNIAQPTYLEHQAKEYRWKRISFGVKSLSGCLKWCFHSTCDIGMLAIYKMYVKSGLAKVSSEITILINSLDLPLVAHQPQFLFGLALYPVISLSGPPLLVLPRQSRPEEN